MLKTFLEPRLSYASLYTYTQHTIEEVTSIARWWWWWRYCGG